MTILANRLIRGSITQKNSKIVLGVWFWMLRSFHLQDFYLSLPFTIFCSSTGGFFSVSAINIVSSAYLMMLHLRLLIMNVRLLIFSGSPHCKGWGFKANPKSVSFSKKLTILDCWCYFGKNKPISQFRYAAKIVLLF